MPTSHFDRTALPPARTFYSREFGSALGRERRGWAQTKCCFHDGESKTSLSLNLDEGHFYCFSCGAKGGDVIAFVQLRYKLDFPGAAKELGAWRDEITPAEGKEFRRREAERQRQRDEDASREELQRRERLAVRDDIHADTRLMKQISSRLRADVTNDQLWRCLQLTWESRELSERQYMRMAGLDYTA